MNRITRMMKSYIKMPLRYALPLLFVCAIVLTATTGCTSNTATPTPTAQATAAPSATVAQNSPSASLSYAVVDQWGGSALKGQRIVVPQSYVNDATMKQLAQKIKSDVAGDSNAIIMVFTSEQAAMIQKAGPKTDAERQIMRPAYLGNFQKNGQTGACSFDYCLGGFSNYEGCNVIQCKDI